ncbi:HIT domain-containing protein [Pseudoalteromonas sp. MEBiC 03607]|jgi:diadenosine tetraphosphate (Ap4A) HIT family hydrolase|uniref:HIT domain-containing protein n=1 Tax=Pseudoalteromonas TaxID=53246 RepID=UPI000C5C48D8|nr:MULTISPECIES: HIT domain-containing protein [unclassified Pseudoalteromonas]MBU77338.1 HIT family protein [Pseudoalteromonadaceae bacterium]HCV01733.1 HIT family protein [Pseudoalteromonas sp.]MCF2898981.1 HIT domain-containing protein [Pseudoalteromonas sp. OFAV1]MCF2921889.1 HIT domain-containing protein [Pseudoalteromonas sp. APAL1]MCO7249652.1 HIT domain-containing protein [Pseudoalteromonas sp. Ps84H-4]|tara:strand:+ start:79 stop:483 length:405 start_codon:yes stop_codon:yes gene_type:complete
MKNADMLFSLAPELARDCIELADWPLCKVLLMNDSQYPWFILVPRQAGLREIIDLSEELQIVFLQESAKLSKLIQQVFTPDKLNVAALGNMVPQLHIHHIARFKSDPAWPAPVWGKLPAIPYTDEQIKQLKAHF